MGSSVLLPLNRLVTDAVKDHRINNREAAAIAQEVMRVAGDAPDAQVLEPGLQEVLTALGSNTFVRGAMPKLSAAIEVATSGRATCTELGWETFDSERHQRQTLRFDKHSGGEMVFPLGAEEQQRLAPSNAVSPILSTDFRVVVPPDYLADPKHPGDAAFWDEFETVLDMQVRRRAGLSASAEFELPRIFDGKTMDEAAQAVRADFPTEFPTALAVQFLKEGARVDTDILPALTRGEFVNATVALAEIIGWAVSAVSPSAFASKWTYGRARPESVAWAIHQGELRAPARIQKKVAALGLTKPEDFTAFKEGAPRHPAYPAMHSAASSASLYLAVVLNLTPEQVAEARRLDYAVSTSRSLAGVHYEADNLAGLSIAQEVMARALPEFLARRFGADPEKVKAKLAEFRYDWQAHPRPASAKGTVDPVVRERPAAAPA